VSCIKVLSEESILSGSHDGKIRFWCLKKNICFKTSDAHSNAIIDIQVLSYNQVASCSEDETIKIWNLISGSCEKKIKDKNEINSIDFF